MHRPRSLPVAARGQSDIEMRRVKKTEPDATSWHRVLHRSARPGRFFFLFSMTAITRPFSFFVEHCVFFLLLRATCRSK